MSGYRRFCFSFFLRKFLTLHPPATLFTFGNDFILTTHRAIAVLHRALVPNPRFERPRPWCNQIRYFALTLTGFQ